MHTKRASTFICLISVIFLSSCSSTIQPVGNIGPKKLGVYAIAQSDFLTANRMLVILNEKGNVVAYTGGTVAGAGTIGLQTAGTLATAGAVAYSANAIQHGLENASVNVKGIPSHVKVDAKIDASIDGKIHTK